MTIVDGNITKASESELYKYYLSRGYDEVYSFTDFMERLKNLGCEIEEGESD